MTMRSTDEMTQGYFDEHRNDFVSVPKGLTDQGVPDVRELLQLDKDGATADTARMSSLLWYMRERILCMAHDLDVETSRADAAEVELDGVKDQLSDLRDEFARYRRADRDEAWAEDAAEAEFERRREQREGESGEDNYEGEDD